MKILVATLIMVLLSSLIIANNKDNDMVCTTTDYFYYKKSIENKVSNPLGDKKDNLNKLNKQKNKVIIEGGYLFETSHYQLNQIKFNCIYSYQFNSLFSIGIGSGLRYYHFFSDGFIPLFADIRINFYDRKITPYFAIETGCSIDLNQRFEFDYVSPLITPSIGICIKTAKKSALNIGLGYEKQKLKVVYNKWYSKYASIKNKGAISLIVGFSF